MYALGMVATTGAFVTAGVSPAFAQRGRGGGWGRGRGGGWGRGRGNGVGAAVGIGVGLALGMGFLIATAFFTKLGDVGALPPLLAAWSPNVLATTGAIYLLLRLRT
jgi:hypothetical protein